MILIGQEAPPGWDVRERVEEGPGRARAVPDGPHPMRAPSAEAVARLMAHPDRRLRSGIGGWAETAKRTAATIRDSAARLHLDRIIPYAATFLAVAGATGAAARLGAYLPVDTLNLAYLMAVLFSARHFGLWPALFGVLLSVNAYNYFFIPPRFSFRIDDPADVAALVFFSVVSVVVSNLTAQSRRQMQSIAEQARISRELCAFSRRILGIGTIEGLLPVVGQQIAAMFRGDVVVLLTADTALEVRYVCPPEQRLDATDFALAWRCLASGEAGRREGEFEVGPRLYLPLRSTDRVVGVVVVNLGPCEGIDHGSLEPVIDQVAVAIERIGLMETVEDARRLAESEKLRSAVLTAISHDLRTPLSGIIGALTSLARPGEADDERTQRELVSVALEEAKRLDRFVGNMLDMAKLEAGGVRVRAEPVDLADVVSEAIRHAGSMLRSRKLMISLPPGLPLALADAVMLERVVFNLLDNAAKHSPLAAPIAITGHTEGEEVLLRVVDEGLGLRPVPGSAPCSGGRRDLTRRPTGLGLSICRGFLDAMGGRIEERNRDDRQGAVFTVRLPMAATVSAVED